MVMVEIKGLHIVEAKGREYVYAWRGGPAIKARPVGGPAFHAEYNQAVADHRVADNSRFRATIIDYRDSDDFRGLAQSTRKVWSRWLDRIRDHFGDLSTAQFDRPKNIRPVIRKWLATYSDRPRTYDFDHLPQALLP